MTKIAMVFGLVAALGLIVGACDDDGGGGGGGGGAKMCLEACTAAADCVTAQMPEEDWRCTGGRCIPHLCDTNDDCLALYSGWTTACTDGGGECLAGYVCINVGGGLCAFAPGAVTCDTMQMSELQKPAIDGSGDIAVCGNDTYTCSNAMCTAPGCTVDADCGAGFCVGGACVLCKTDADCTGAMTKCTSAGFCGCMNDGECSGSTPKCTAQSFCGCGDDDDCSGSTADKCYSGACGCSDVSKCTGTTTGANTTWVCDKS